MDSLQEARDQILATAAYNLTDLVQDDQAGTIALAVRGRVALLSATSMLRFASTIAAEKNVPIGFILSSVNVSTSDKEDVVSFYLSYVAFDDVQVEVDSAEAETWQIYSEGPPLSTEAAGKLLDDLTQMVCGFDFELTVVLGPEQEVS